MFAIVEIAGKQYKVVKGDMVLVDKLAEEVGKTVVFDKVLLTSGDGKTSVGKPKVAGVKVTAKVIKHIKGDKVDVRRYKSKVRYRRARGFRPQLTEVEIVAVG